MADYKATLNLPNTDFAMKANLSGREPEMLKRWQGIDLYNRLRAQRQGQSQFILHDGPPYANGDIHIGHAVNKILKDIIVKSKTLSGFDAPYVPGWDCHGLPIEHQVEKKIGKVGGKVDAATFRKACRDYAAKQIDRQREDFKRLGVLGDWERPYLTMDYRFEADTVRALGKIIANGHLHKGHKPVHWCMDCGSALAEAEVEYENRRSPAIDVRFRVLDDAALLARCGSVQHAGAGPLSMVIWTTTPWTLPANEAVALNAGLDYVVVEISAEQGRERVVLAEALLDDAMQRWDINEHRIVGTCRGADLEGLKLQHPFYDKQVPVILGEHVTTEAGTGAVHTAPAHGQEDYVAGARYHLPVHNPVGPDGKFFADVPLFGGQHVLAANDNVLVILRERGNLVHAAALQHSYPHCWRHKTPVIFRATPQWFIAMDQQGLRAQAEKDVKNVRWFPDWGQARIAGMVQNRPDWCISRQRTWGVPITLFVHTETQQLHPQTQELLEKAAKLIEQRGIEAWFELDAKEFLGADAARYAKVTDTLDVWFDSGVTHFAVLHARKDLRFPADLYIEGSDQHRGWFQSSLLTSVAMYNTAPYRQVLTYGFTVDAQGRKMSKSVGNVIAPQQICNSLGADILRLWVSATDYTREMAVSDETLKRIADAYRRLRNTARFLLSNLHGFDPARDLVRPDEMIALDRWAVQRAQTLQMEIVAAYDTYDFPQIYQLLHNFCSVDMGSFYLDVVKDRQYTGKADGQPRRSTQSAMYHIVGALARWMAPVLSFTAEEIYLNIPAQQGASVLLETWYEFPPVALQGVFTPAYWQELLAVREVAGKELEKLRVAGGIGAGLDAEVDLYCGQELYAALQHMQDELRFALITSYARLHRDTARPAHAVHYTLASNNELWIAVAPSAHAKCARCWHHREDVGRHVEHPELCGRCIENIAGMGEVRRFA
ncbi:MAG: isoleucine--tRNA ligase [Pseudomonadota bacterium]